MELYPRTVDQLRKGWENICLRTKEDVGKNKQSRRQTGGGPAEPEMSSLSAPVAGVRGEALSPLENNFDGDKRIPWLGRHRNGRVNFKRLRIHQRHSLYSEEHCSKVLH